MSNPASDYIISITMLSPVIEEKMEIDWKQKPMIQILIWDMEPW